MDAHRAMAAAAPAALSAPAGAMRAHAGSAAGLTAMPVQLLRDLLLSPRCGWLGLCPRTQLAMGEH